MSNTPSLPSLPHRDKQNLMRALISSQTADSTRWDLMHELDLSIQIHGMPLLMAFMLNNIHLALDRDQMTFPAHPGEPWPDPINHRTQERDEPGPWIAAALICNSEDALDWETTYGQDLIEMLIERNNQCLLDQALRKASTEQKQKLTQDSKYLVCATGLRHPHRSRVMLQVLFSHGWDPNARLPNGKPLLHTLRNPQAAQAYLEAGADPFSVYRKKTLFQSWQGQASAATLAGMLKVLDQHAMAIDPDRARKQAIPALFEILANKAGADGYLAHAEHTMGLDLAHCRKDTGQPISVMGACAIHSMQGANGTSKDLRETLFRLLANASLEDLAYCGVDQATDLALAWINAGQHSTSATEHPGGDRGFILDRLVQLGLDPLEAQARIWREVAMAAYDHKGRLPWIGTAPRLDTDKTLEAIFEESYMLGDPQPRDAERVLKTDPGVLPLLFENQSNGQGMATVALMLPRIARRVPELAQACLQAAVGMARCLSPNDDKIAPMLDALNTMLDGGMIFDLSFDGAEKRLDRFNQMAKEPEFGPARYTIGKTASRTISMAECAGRIQASMIGQSTPDAKRAARPSRRI